jgi:ABC-type antimicrobial peptide transport system permease subunit
MFFARYMVSELRRRKGRTTLTALGLAIGVGLVVAVGALSTGLDRAQAKVLRPLTGVGTDLSVTRPIRFSGGTPTFGAGPRGGLSPSERAELRKENGATRFGLQNLGKPGTHFSRESFLATSQLSFPASRVADVRRLANVRSASGSLTLTALRVSGVVPRQTAQQGFGPPGGGFGGRPRNINFDSRTVTGIDWSLPAIAPVTPGEIVSGHYIKSANQAVLNLSYARDKSIHLGDTIAFGTTTLHVVGFARTPLGGQASDIYMDLAMLQKLSGRTGRVNTIQVRATSASHVGELASAIRASFSGASVTTAKDLADRVSGSLVDAKNLTSKLGLVLEIVGLLAAFLIAALLTLASITKRIRELGTLKAIGWSQRLVVRQITGESLLQGALGAVLGIGVGLAAAALITVFSPTLTATVAQATQQGPRFFAFGQGAVTSGSTSVSLDAPVSIGLVALAVALALLGGLLSGAVGAFRASRLRPADALRHID